MHDIHADNHGHDHGRTQDRGLKKRLALSIALTGSVFIAELVGGYYTNSLALSSDATHVFMDVLALSLSLFAIHISGLAPTEKRTYGLHRAEVFASFINSVTIMGASVFIAYKAYWRLVSPEPVESVGMLVVASGGLVVNLAVAFWLRHYAERDMNVRSAFLHVVGDAAASVGVIVGAIVIMLTGYYAVDPIISFAIAAVIFYGALRILRDSSHILLEGVPKDVNLGSVVSDIKSARGVAGVHSLHVWSICHNVHALSAHVDIIPTERWRMGEVFEEINSRLAVKHRIFYTTLQAECSGCDRLDVLRKLSHVEHDHGHLH